MIYELIIKEISTELNIPVDLIKGRNRERTYTLARQMCYGIIHSLKEKGFNLGYVQLSKIFKHDHSTGINSKKSHLNDYQTNEIYKNNFDVFFNKISKNINIKDFTNYKLFSLLYIDNNDLKQKLTDKIKEIV
jgi:hypothetical protein